MTKKCSKCNEIIKDKEEKMYWNVGFDDVIVRFCVVGYGGFGYVGRSRGVFHKKCYKDILKYAGVK